MNSKKQPIVGNTAKVIPPVPQSTTRRNPNVAQTGPAVNTQQLQQGTRGAVQYILKPVTKIGTGAESLIEDMEQIKLATGDTVTAATYIGEKKGANEDIALIIPEHNVVLIGDGMGGYGGGDIASAILAEEVTKNPTDIRSAAKSAQERMDNLGKEFAIEAKKVLREAFFAFPNDLQKAANAAYDRIKPIRIFGEAAAMILKDRVTNSRNDIKAGMESAAEEFDKLKFPGGLCFVYMQLEETADGKKRIKDLVRVGDVRLTIYDGEDGSVKFETKDESVAQQMISAGWVEEEALNHPQRHKVTNALTASKCKIVDIDPSEFPELNPGDIIWGNSDGPSDNYTTSKPNLDDPNGRRLPGEMYHEFIEGKTDVESIEGLSGDVAFRMHRKEDIKGKKRKYFIDEKSGLPTLAMTDEEKKKPLVYEDGGELEPKIDNVVAFRTTIQ